MPVLVKDKMFDYLAHIVREDGSVIELSGTRRQDNHNEVYQWLLKRAQELSGHLVSQNISDSGEDVPWEDAVPNPLLMPDPKPERSTRARVVVPSVFDDTSVFGTFNDTYSGASPITYKVTKE